MSVGSPFVYSQSSPNFRVHPNLNEVESAEGTIFYYNDATGFVGHVAQVGNKIYVSYRGTDLAGGMGTALGAALEAKIKVGWGDSDYVDHRDFDTNVRLGSGTTLPSQLDDALVLYDMAARYAAQQESSAPGTTFQVIVSGQSLGGGLSGLVSGITGAEGYGIDSAPFLNQFRALAITQAAHLLPSNVVIDDAFVGLTDASISFKLHFQYGIDAAKILEFLNEYSEIQDDYFHNFGNKYHMVFLEGEALNSESATTYDFLKISAKHFGLNPADVARINAGDGSEASLHGPALANLMIRTEGMSGLRFSDLMKGDKAIRDAFLDKDLGSVDVYYRIDPNGSPSRQAGGMNPSPFYNALWKTSGDGASGFYESFYRNMSALKLGMAGYDKSETSLSASSLHQGLVRLGIEAARDGIDRSDSGDVLNFDGNSLNFFGDTSKGYVKLDLGDILDRRTYDLPPSSNPTTIRPSGIFGVDEIDHWVADKILDRVSLTQNAPFHSSMGWTPDNVIAGIFRTNTPWSKVVVQAGDGTSLNYVDEDNENTLVIGGSGANEIHSGSGQDILIGGDGGNVFWGSMGPDKVFGGSGLDVVDYSLSNAGVAIDLSNRIVGSNASVQHGGFAEGDVLVGIEKVIGASEFFNTFKGTDAHEEFFGGSKGDIFSLTKGFDKLVGGQPGDENDTRDVIDVSGYVQAENLPARGFDIDLRAGTVIDRNGSTNLAELVGIDGAIGSIHDDRFVATSIGGTFDGGLGWDTLYLGGLWSSYSYQMDYPGYACRIYDANGNECLVNGVESFVFGGTAIGAEGERLSFASLANRGPSAIFLGHAIEGRNVATVVYNDVVASAGGRLGDVPSDLTGGDAAASDYVHESNAVIAGGSATRQLIGHVTALDANKFDVVNVRLDDRSKPFFELDSDGSIYLKAGVALDYAAWKANTDPRIDGNTMADPIGEGILNSLGNEIATQLGEKYVARLVATDAGGKSFSDQIVFKVAQGTNSAPDQIALSTKYVPDWVVHYGWDYTVGTLSAVDADGDAIVWDVPMGAGKPFAVDGNTLILVNPGALVVGADGWYHVTVTASDGKAQVATDIAIKKNTLPSMTWDLPDTISDLTAVGTTIGHLTGSDPDTGQSLQFSAWSNYVKLVGNDIVLTQVLDASTTPQIDIGAGITDGMDGTYSNRSLTVVSGNAQPGDPTAFGFQSAVAELTERAEPIDGSPINRADVMVGTISTPSGYGGRMEIRVDGYATDERTFEIRNGNELWIRGDARLDREALGADGMLKFQLIATDTSGENPTRTALPQQSLHVLNVDEGFGGMHVMGETIDLALGTARQSLLYVSDPDVYETFQASIISGGDVLEFMPAPDGYSPTKGMPQIRLKEGAVIEGDTFEATFGVTEANGTAHTLTQTFSVIRPPKPTLTAEFNVLKYDLNYDSDTSQPLLLGRVAVTSAPGEVVTVSLDGYGDQVFQVVKAQDGNWDVFLKPGVSTYDAHRAAMASGQGDFPFLMSNLTFTAGAGREATTNIGVHMGNAPEAYLDWQRTGYDMNVTANHPDGKRLGSLEIFNDSPYSTYELVGDIAQHVWMTKVGNHLVFDWIASQVYSPGVAENIMGNVRIHNSWDDGFRDEYLNVFVHDIPAQTAVVSNVASLSYATDPHQHVKVADLDLAGWSGDISISFGGYGAQVLDAIQGADGKWGIYLKDDLTMTEVHRAMKLGEGWYDYALNSKVIVNDNLTGSGVSIDLSANVANPSNLYIDWSNWVYDGNIHYNAPDGKVMGYVPFTGDSDWTFSLSDNLAQHMGVSTINGKIQFEWLPGQNFGYDANWNANGKLIASSSWSDTTINIFNFGFSVTPFAPPSDIRVSTDIDYLNYGINATTWSVPKDIATVFLDGIRAWNSNRESHIHLTTDNPSVFKLTLDPVSYIEKLSIKEGAQLLPGRIYSTTLTAWDDTFPDVAPVTETVSFQVNPAKPYMSGMSGDWGSYYVGQLATNDPFDHAGGPDQYYYSIVGGRDDLFDIVGNKLVAPNGMDQATDAHALVQILTESNYGFSRVDTYSVDIGYYFGAFHRIDHIG